MGARISSMNPPKLILLGERRNLVEQLLERVFGDKKRLGFLLSIYTPKNLLKN